MTSAAVQTRADIDTHDPVAAAQHAVSAAEAVATLDAAAPDDAPEVIAMSEGDLIRAIEGAQPGLAALWNECCTVDARGDDETAVRVTIAQARAAIGALRPADEIDDSDTEVAAGAWEASTIGMAPSACLCGVQGWIDEVLK